MRAILGFSFLVGAYAGDCAGKNLLSNLEGSSFYSYYKDPPCTNDITLQAGQSCKAKCHEADRNEAINFFAQCSTSLDAYETTWKYYNTDNVELDAFTCSPRCNAINFDAHGMEVAAVTPLAHSDHKDVAACADNQELQWSTKCSVKCENADTVLILRCHGDVRFGASPELTLFGETSDETDGSSSNKLGETNFCTRVVTTTTTDAPSITTDYPTITCNGRADPSTCEKYHPMYCTNPLTMAAIQAACPVKCDACTTSTGQCNGNTNPNEDIDCSSSTNTENKGGEGNTIAICCIAPTCKRDDMVQGLVGSVSNSGLGCVNNLLVGDVCAAACEGYENTVYQAHCNANTGGNPSWAYHNADGLVAGLSCTACFYGSAPTFMSNIVPGNTITRTDVVNVRENGLKWGVVDYDVSPCDVNALPYKSPTNDAYYKFDSSYTANALTPELDSGWRPPSETVDDPWNMFGWDEKNSAPFPKQCTVQCDNGFVMRVADGYDVTLSDRIDFETQSVILTCGDDWLATANDFRNEDGTYYDKSHVAVNSLTGFECVSTACDRAATKAEEEESTNSIWCDDVDSAVALFNYDTKQCECKYDVSECQEQCRIDYFNGYFEQSTKIKILKDSTMKDILFNQDDGDDDFFGAIAARFFATYGVNAYTMEESVFAFINRTLNTEEGYILLGENRSLNATYNECYATCKSSATTLKTSMAVLLLLLIGAVV
jgi:hypothetical protein